MKYSIIISPIHQNSIASTHAFKFIQAILKQKEHQISVFFYGYAVKSAFEIEPHWQNIKSRNVSLTACSTIADNYLKKQKKLVDYMVLAGLGQWMESVHDADKNIEFA